MYIMLCFTPQLHTVDYAGLCDFKASRGYVKPLRFPCFWVSFSIELNSSMWMEEMNIKNFRFEVLMTAIKKNTACCNSFQTLVNSSMAL
jgi:hypothetical protein